MVDSTNPPKDTPLPDSRFAVVLVEPQFRDNVGHTARAMLNFGVSELILCRAPPVDDVTRNRAVHAQGVLNAARHVGSLEDVRRDFAHVVGFAARISTINKAHSRLSESLPHVARRLEETTGRVALVFGREDFGLSNEDVGRCDQLCTIPTDRYYRSMNLSHAVSVALYELTRLEQPKMPYVSMATPEEKEILFRSYRHLNAALGFQEHRVEQADHMFRRVIGRSTITAWEYHRLMGTISRQLKVLGKWPPPGVGGGAYTERDEGAADADERQP